MWHATDKGKDRQHSSRQGTKKKEELEIRQGEQGRKQKAEQEMGQRAQSREQKAQQKVGEQKGIGMALGEGAGLNCGIPAKGWLLLS